MSDHKKVVIGQISSPHGIKGWLKVVSYTDPIENIITYKNVLINKNDEEILFEVEDYTISGKTIRIKLAGIDDRNMSEELSKAQILIDRKNLPEISDGHYYWNDLLGLNIKNTDQTDLGILQSFFETGSNDVMVVVRKNKQRILIPFINNEVVKSVDLDSKEIIVEWSEIE